MESNRNKLKASEIVEIKPKRIRSNPVKRWTTAEERMLTDYLMENRDFEKPTGQKYYRRFSEENGVIVDWKLVRAKVRNMRVNFGKAKAWLATPEADTLDRKTIKTTLLKMFEFYYEFDEIFGDRLLNQSVPDTADTKENITTFTTFWGDELDDDDDVVKIKSSPARSDLISIEDEDPVEIDDAFSIDDPVGVESVEEIEYLPNTSRRGQKTKTAMSDILKLQTAMISLKKQKLDQEFTAKEREISLREREVAIKEKELDLKQKEILSQERLKEREIRSHEKLRMLELEMKERLAKEELKRKYKYEM